MSQYAGCRKDMPCSHESACFYQSTRKCAFLLPFCILRHRPSFLKLWGFGEDAIACRNTLGVARTCLARASPLTSTKAHACVLFCCSFCFTTPTLFFLKVLVEDKILYGVNAIKFNVDMPFRLFTKTVQ